MSLVVLASGSGSNLQAIIDAGLPVAAVVSNSSDAFALQRARVAGIPGVVVDSRGVTDRRTYDARLADLVQGFTPQWVVLAGWMRILTTAFLDHFPSRVVNLHPALPGELPGLNAVERAYAEFLSGARLQTGVMVHLVPDEQVDAGPVLGTVTVPMLAGDTLHNLTARVHAAEHALLVEVLRSLVGQAPQLATTRSHANNQETRT